MAVPWMEAPPFSFMRLGLPPSARFGDFQPSRFLLRESFRQKELASTQREGGRVCRRRNLQDPVENQGQGSEEQRPVARTQLPRWQHRQATRPNRNM